MKESKDINKIIYIYCRVSTSGQGRDGVSLDVQEQRGLEVSKKLGLTPIVIKEQGSGLKPYIDERPLFTILIDDILDEKVKNVWIDDNERLTRNDIDLQTIHLQMKQNEINLYVGITNEPKKWDWITDLVDTITTKVNQQQIRNQIRKSIRSKRKLFQEGCYMKGDSPFGYILKDKKLVPHPINKDWVVKIFDWYDTGKSTWWIRNELFINGVNPPRYKYEGQGFTFQTVVNILSNKNYIGLDVYDDLTNECPKLVDKKVFRSVQKKRQTKSVRSSNPKYDFLLKGIIKCPDGTDMSSLGIKKSRKNPLYSCRHRIRGYDKRPNSDGCPISSSLRVNILDKYIWNQLVNVLSQSHQIKEQTKKELLGNKVSYTKRSINNNLKKIQKELFDLEGNSLELDKKFYTNQMDKKKYDILIKVINGRQDELMNEMKSLEMKLDHFSKNEQWIDWLDVHFNRMEEIRNMETFKKRRETIQHYIHEIIVLDYNEDTKQHTLSVKFRFPLFDDKFEWLKNKDGSFKRDRNGQRISKITEGESHLTNPFTPHYLLYCYRLC
jgi:site-specific DNA recombinase